MVGIIKALVNKILPSSKIDEVVIDELEDGGSDLVVGYGFFDRQDTPPENPI
jgi:hypothetical protein